MYKSKYNPPNLYISQLCPYQKKKIVSPVNIENNSINKLMLLRIKIMKINIEKIIQQYFPANTTIIRLISSILSSFPNWFHPCISQSAMTIRLLRFLVYNSRQQRSRRSNESIRNQLDRSPGFKGRSGVDRGLLFPADGLNPWRWTT